MLEVIYIIIIALFGLAFGSFFNVVIYRLRDKKSLLGRSSCPKCNHELKALDLIPVFSFLFLGGKCRYCKEKISWQYFIVELTTSLLFISAFVLNYFFKEFNWMLLVRDLIVVSAFIIIFVYDVRYMEIPDEVSIPASILILILNILVTKNFELFLLGGTIGACFFLIQFIVSKGLWIGGGDIRLGLLIGVLFGPYYAIIAIFLSYLIGTIYSFPILINKYFNKNKENINQNLNTVPMAPFLVIGSIIVLFFMPIISQILK